MISSSLFGDWWTLHTLRIRKQYNGPLPCGIKMQLISRLCLGMICWTAFPPVVTKKLIFLFFFSENTRKHQFLWLYFCPILLTAHISFYLLKIIFDRYVFYCEIPTFSLVTSCENWTYWPYLLMYFTVNVAELVQVFTLACQVSLFLPYPNTTKPPGTAH